MSPGFAKVNTDAYSRFGRYLAGAWVLAFAALGILGVIARSIPSALFQVSWIDELTRLILVWMVFLGCGLVSEGNGHFRIDIIVDLVPQPLRNWIYTVGDAFVAGFLVLLMSQSFPFALSQMHQRTTILEWPVGLYPLALVVGSVLMLAFTVLRVILRHRGNSG